MFDEWSENLLFFYLNIDIQITMPQFVQDLLKERMTNTGSDGMIDGKGKKIAKKTQTFFIRN